MGIIVPIYRLLFSFQRQNNPIRCIPIMTNSHLLGFILFGVCALFAVLTWYVSNNHAEIRRNPAQRRRTQITALCFLLFGAGFGYLAFSIDNQMRIVTLHEVMVEGNSGLSAGAPAPTRTIDFTVEHPGTEHELFISPTSDLTHLPQSDAEVRLSLEGPSGQILVSERTEIFGMRMMTRNQRADWNGKSFPFTPTVAGPHTVRVTPLTAGIPRIQVRVEDPLKRDGKRMPGY